jgi:hypothetical protein
MISQSAGTIHLTSPQCNGQSVFSVRCLQRPRKRPVLPFLTMPKPETTSLSTDTSDTFPSPISLDTEIGAGLWPAYPAGDDSASILPSMAPESRRVRWLPPAAASKGQFLSSGIVAVNHYEEFTFHAFLLRK